MEKIRPLGKLSDFVVEEMPTVLAGSPDKLPAIILGYLSGLSFEERVAAFGEHLAVARLDLKFCEAAQVHSGQVVPEALIELIDEICKPGFPAEKYPGCLPGLTYHELVEVNPEEDLRLFTPGGVGETERLFYNAHRYSEQQLAIVLDQVQVELAALDHGRQPVYDATAQLKALKEFAKFSRRPDGMAEGHFMKFNVYLGQNKPRKHLGPSGRFTWRVPALELLVLGYKLPHWQEIERFANEGYYPPEGRLAIGQAFGRARLGKTYAELVKTSATKGRAIQLIDAMHAFRMVHLQMVRHQNPDAYEDKKAGTSGEPAPGTYLRNRIEEMRGVQAWLKELPISED